ncbi:MAG: SpoIIE family protein phosphatase [Synergistaceae bacterium]|nr:SpoIIE family protein phosphatase [Synergistaceae bacterium]
MKRSFARKLTAKLATLIFIIMAISIIGSYFIISDIVQTETSKYNASLAGVIGDLIWQKARDTRTPIISEKMTKYIDFCCDYICKWYHVDYMYIYSISDKENTMKLLSFSYKESDRHIFEKAQHAFGKILSLGDKTLPDDYNGLIGAEIHHIPTEAELKIWVNHIPYSSQRSNRFEPALESLYSLTNDGYGSRVVVVTGIFTREIKEEIAKAYMPFVSAILCIFIFMTIIIYFLIRHSVFKPIQKLVDSMMEFITDGKRSKVSLDTSSNDEFAMIASAFNTMSDNIDKYIKENNQLTSAEERRKTEAKIATMIQKGFLAPPRFNTQEYEIVAKMVPAKEVGGDLYEYLDLGDGRVLLTIGDVSGKGYAPSFYMAVALVLIHQYATVGLTPAQILENVNETFCSRNPSLLFITAFVGIFDIKTGVLTYSNAGHNPPYVLRDRLEPLKGAQNILLGLYKGEKFTQEEIHLSAGESLFLYTDGVNEAIDATNNFFGTERLENVLSKFHASHEKDLVEYVYRAVRNFTGGSEQSDDITMLAFTVKYHFELELSPDTADFTYIREILLTSDLPRQLQLTLCVAAEEIFVNICSYAFKEQEKKGQIIRFVFEHFDRIIMRFEDCGIAYNPTDNVISGTDYDLDEQVGGLGQLIAFSIADEVTYERVDDKNILTITKYLYKEENK